MQDFLTLILIGVTMGTFGGLIGVGGSIIMIPAMVFAFGENQHLYQASAMICNFFVTVSAAIVHRKANILVRQVLKWFIPAALIGVIAGVWLSNSALFAGKNSYLLARIFGVFIVYAVVHTALKLGRNEGGSDGMDLSDMRYSLPRTILGGTLTGIGAGLLGVGGGIIATPLQQLLLKMPFKRAVSNSAATIASISLAGAFYKNITLSQHNISILQSLEISMIIVPAAFIGGFWGGRLMHKLPQDVVRIVFIVLAAISAIKLLTVAAH